MVQTAAMSDDDVFAVTTQGNAQVKRTGTSLTFKELEVLVLVDGASTVSQVCASARDLSATEVRAILQRLIDRRMIARASEPSALETGFLAIPVPPGFFSAKGAPLPEAEHGVASLKQRGYFVRIARRAAQKRAVKAGWHPTILVVDDDPDLMKLVRTYFRLEGFGIREATKRDEIMAAFRQGPLPDLVMLDVHLPDADGFDVLARMRQHAILKSVPVVMITAEATREAVLKGLQAGADGYITKPFEPEFLVTAVKEVLGLKAG